MAYSLEVVHRARQRLDSAKADRESELQARLQRVYAQLPRVREIDILLRKSMALAAQAAFTGGGNAYEAMEKVKQENLSLQQERKALVQAHFGENYLDESPLCSHCGGAGYVGSTMCTCLQELCRQEQRKLLSLLNQGQDRFEDFRLDYYPDRTDGKYGASPRVIMEHNYKICRKYAQTFSANSGNLLFVGGTGLGKTFLSACIAGEVAEKGYSVAYEPAAHLFAKLEKNRFNPDERTQAEAERIHACDLLIVDDLGTELSGNFVTAALYTLLNDRLLAGKPMIISTNLNMDETARRYSAQIASRLQGSFQMLPFVGEDIRVLKKR